MAQIDIIDVDLQTPIHGVSTSHLDNKHYYKLPHSHEDYLSIVLFSDDALAVYSLSNDLPYE